MKILILDYSVDRSETAAIRRWLPADAQVSAFFIDTASSFPGDLADADFTHVIHSGSARSIVADAPFTAKAVAFIRRARDKGIWQMGICYGHQLLCRALVGAHAVRKSPNGLEAGWGSVEFIDHAPRRLGVRPVETVWQHHFDEVVELSAGSELLATSRHSLIQAYVNDGQRLLGTQFHPEFDRDAGNAIFMDDKSLAKHGYDAAEIVKGGPSLDAGAVFFGFFLNPKR
jgi:GMP synthase (glutamine-hydrolysing)